MYIKRTFPLRGMLYTSWHHLLWLTLYGLLALGIRKYVDWEWLNIPWLPISLIGTAVAFYIGFKNNTSYSRMWEARKIWGAIVNTSRSLSTMVKNYVDDQWTETKASDQELRDTHQRIMHRHIAWLYVHRDNMLKPKSWEHSAARITRDLANRRINRMRSLFDFRPVEEMVSPYLEQNEMNEILAASNGSTQLLDKQSEEFKQLYKKGWIDDFRHVSLQNLITDLYTQQGKNERIKGFPLPRQYGSTSFYFIAIFILLLPFGFMTAFDEMGVDLKWLSVPFTTIVGWVYIMMELAGDYSENPFEGLPADIPMLSICRTIEIDVLEMLGEENIPPKIEEKEGFLM